MLVGKQVPHLIYWPNGFSAFDQSFKSSYGKKASKGGFFKLVKIKSDNPH
jgi:hypothetical protein